MRRMGADLRMSVERVQGRLAVSELCVLCSCLMSAGLGLSLAVDDATESVSIKLNITDN